MCRILATKRYVDILRYLEVFKHRFLDSVVIQLDKSWKLASCSLQHFDEIDLRKGEHSREFFSHSRFLKDTDTGVQRYCMYVEN